MSTTGTTHTLVVEAGKAGRRVDLFIGEALGLSRAKLKKLFESGAVKVEGRAAKKGLLVAAGQRITVVVPEERREVVPEPEAPLAVLHEDAALVFVDKPAGKPSHPLQPGDGHGGERAGGAPPSARGPRRTSARAGCATGWTSRPPG